MSKDLFENRARTVLIGRDVVINKGAGATDPLTSGHGAVDNNLEQLAPGAFAFITDKGDLIPAAAATVVAEWTDVRAFQIAVGGNAGTYPTLSPMIQRHGAFLDHSAYVAPVAQVVTVTNAFITAAKDNMLAMMIEIQSDFNTHRGNKKRFEIVMKEGESNAAAVLRLVNLINAEFGDYVTAADVGPSTSITLTAVDPADILLVGVYADFDDSTVATTTETTFGIGTSDWALEVEDAAAVNQGDTSRVHLNPELYSKPSVVVDGVQYQVWSIEFDDIHESGIAPGVSGRSNLLMISPNVLTTPLDADLPAMLAAAFNLAVAPIEDGEVN